MVLRPGIWFLAVVCLAAQPAGAAQPSARVIDGDTLDVGGERIRLSGIDAPERNQQCFHQGEPWSCGQAATAALRAKVGDAPLDCAGEDRDRYGRTVATCQSEDGTDLNGWMVEEGWAMAYRQYSTAYVPAEERARTAGRGIWSGEVRPPAAWRAEQRKAALARGKPRP